MVILNSIRSLVLVVSAGLPIEASASEWFDWNFYPINEPCQGNCAVSVFGGYFVEDFLDTIIFELIPFWTWNYEEDYIVGASVSRRILSFYDAIHLEPEIGIAQRFGRQHETEFWAALYIRYSAFPWNNYIYTTIGTSFGLSYATGVSDLELRLDAVDGGDRLLHYFSPEITLALPKNRDTELFFRFHHRSGVYGLVSGHQGGGAHYATVGLRFRF